MKTAIVTLAALMCSASLAFAQTPGTGTAPGTRPAPDTAQTRPSTDSSTKDTPPLKGANSFTEGEAKKRAEARGFSDVKDLKKDNDGIWRGRATQQGKAVQIAVDYKGNVVSTAQQ